MSRYDRQMLIDGWSQEKLNKSKVLIAGVGALGSVVAINLALSGVKKLILVDMDTIEVTNLNRQLLYRKKDVTKFKSEVAASRLREMNPDIDIVSLPMKIEEVKRSYYQDVNVIVAGLDSYGARRWLNSLAVDINKPLISGGMYSLLGQVQRIIPYKTPCFECQPLIPQEKLSQACSPVGQMRKNQPKKPVAPMPAIVTMSMIIGGILSQETLKLLMNLGSPLDNYFFYDGYTNTATILSLERNPRCPVCGEFYNLKESSITIENGEMISEIALRIAFQFGLSEPRIMYKGIILDNSFKIKRDNIVSGSKLFVIDDRLAKPLKLTIQKRKKE